MDVNAAYLLFLRKGWEPSKYYNMGRGEKAITRAFLREEAKLIKELEGR